MAHQWIILCGILFCTMVNINVGHSFHHRQHRKKHKDRHDDWDWIHSLQRNHQRKPLSHFVQPSKDFSYSNNGNWAASFRECGGRHQSPIDIQTRRVHFSTRMPDLTFRNFWDNENQVIINNTGKRVDIMLDGEWRMPTIEGGPLLDAYEFVDLHFHWGKNDSEGSEHTINSQAFPMEAHLVHFRKAYGTIKVAAQHFDGIAVVAFLFEIDDTEGIKDFSEVVADLSLIRKAHSAVKISSARASFHWFKNLIDGPYFTYAGSLTTPPCSEVVTWIIFQRSIKISRRQMEEFRKLESPNGHKITNNHRSIQHYVQPHIVTAQTMGSSQSEVSVSSLRFTSSRLEESPHHLSSFGSHHPDFFPHWFERH